MYLRMCLPAQRDRSRGALRANCHGALCQLYLCHTPEVVARLELWILFIYPEPVPTGSLPSEAMLPQDEQTDLGFAIGPQTALLFETVSSYLS